jgi:hypothetical protein
MTRNRLSDNPLWKHKRSRVKFADGRCFAPLRRQPQVDDRSRLSPFLRSKRISRTLSTACLRRRLKLLQPDGRSLESIVVAEAATVRKRLDVYRSLAVAAPK